MNQNLTNALLLDDEIFAVKRLSADIPWKELGIDQADCVSSVREAKAYLQMHPVNILICDIEMPGENGLDMVEWATEYTHFSPDPMVCIILTCHPEYEYLRKAMQLGCLDYLLKPVDLCEMKQCLEKAVTVLQEKRLENSRSSLHIDNLQKREDLLSDKVFPFIESHLSSQFSISDIADYVGLNPQYLMRIFRKATGLSILEYVTAKRIEYAKEMLIRTDWPLTVISEKAGYLNYTYFMKVFKSSESVTPGEYRKRYL